MRRWIIVVGGVGLSLVVVLVSSCATAAGTVEEVSGNEPFPDAAIMFLGRDGDYRLAGDPFASEGDTPPDVSQLLPEMIGDRQVLSTSTAQWSPDGRHVAVAAQLAAGRAGGDAPSQVIAVVSPDTGELHVVWEESGAVPFVLGWSPDGRRLALLATQSQPELVLEVLLFAEEPQPFATAASQVDLVKSAPVYFDWAADSETLVVASGSTVTAYDTNTGAASTLTAGNGDFRAPDAGTAGDGVLTIERRGSEQSIVELDSAGRRLPHITAPAGGAFAWNPAGRYFAALRFGGLGLVGAMSVVDTGDVARQISWSPVNQETEPLSNALAYAMEWAPDGNGLLILSPDIEAERRYAARWLWGTPDGSGGWAIRELLRFQPEPAYLATRLPFFDQYTRVESTIAPDAQAFTFAREIEGTGGSSEIVAYRFSDDTVVVVGPGSFPTWRPSEHTGAPAGTNPEL
ncbi:MAG TPA: hypothetical protein VJ932_09260 [Alkalispirochaeta sp.]|nr:hypothetical protein [Alkalispirochaeta sp.]